MQWFLVPKVPPEQVRAGSYKDWKPELAVEGREQCVYCAIPDRRMGGLYVFHVEHFVPKSRDSNLTNEWGNLFYSCPICNVFKGADWPEPGSPISYVDPSKVDYSTILLVQQDASVIGLTTNARYMIERLNLNRAQLRLERRDAFLWIRYHEAARAIDAMRPKLRLLPAQDRSNIVDRVLEISGRVREASERVRTSSLYGPGDTRRAAR
ncbi:MAG: endonuclease family protein [Gemmatimonadetes bacterium]|nr:endonuclease family protein [Gemmatimonadota bacterium]